MLAQEGGAVSEFFTLATLGGFAGATSATLLIGNVAGFLWPNPIVQKWVAFVGALIISFVVFIVGVEDADGGDYLIALLNGFAIYAAAYGLNESTVSTGSWNQ